MRSKKRLERKKSKSNWIKEIVIAVLATALVLFLIKPVVVKQHSMQPTVDEGNIILLNKGLYLTPEIGDVIVFNSTIKDRDGKKMKLIKRVIGVEGDIITIANGKLFRNGIEVEENYIYDTNPIDVYNYVVPEDQVYVLGDHREVSRDSRELGSIDKSTIIGRAILRIYPLNEIGIIK